MEPFKNSFNRKRVNEIADALSKKAPSFDRKNFVRLSMSGLEQLELKARVIQIADAIHEALPGSYASKLKVFKKTLRSPRNPDGLNGFGVWPYSHYIETHGLEDFETSMDALYALTSRFTSEFGIRPLLERSPERVYSQFSKWVGDPDPHIRRWVSEGTRPNLPWGQKISHMPKNLRKNVKLLDSIFNDESEYVRTSVANHMNDITRLDSPLALRTLRRWDKTKKSRTPEMQTLLRKALRTLLKQGDADALALMGFDHRTPSKVTHLKLSKTKLREGDSFELEFDVQNPTPSEQRFMVDYNIHYRKSNGTLSPKTFKLKTITVPAKGTVSVRKKVSFKRVTTRVHYPGKHLVQVQINGNIKAEKAFNLSV